MHSFNVHVLLGMAQDLSELSQWTANDPKWKGDFLTNQDEESAKKCLNAVALLCGDFGFNALLLEVKRNIAEVESDRCTYERLGQISEQLVQRIRDEYEPVVLLWIKDADRYQKDDLFGEQVGEHFKAASFDIKEAGTCYALGRYTACVYHLMRVAESGLRAIGKRVGFTDSRPVWEAVLKYIDAELRRNYDEMSALFKGDVEFLSGVSAHMHAVNLAWRRRVAHIERTYGQDEAKQIFDSTRTLMQHIAKKLSEVAE